MKKNLYRLLTLLLVCTVFTSILLPASATEIDIVNDVVQEEKIDEWYIIEGRATGTLFTIVAGKVWNNLYSETAENSV